MYRPNIQVLFCNDADLSLVNRDYSCSSLMNHERTSFSIHSKVQSNFRKFCEKFYIWKSSERSAKYSLYYTAYWLVQSSTRQFSFEHPVRRSFMWACFKFLSLNFLDVAKNYRIRTTGYIMIWSCKCNYTKYLLSLCRGLNFIATHFRHCSRLGSWGYRALRQRLDNQTW